MSFIKQYFFIYFCYLLNTLGKTELTNNSIQQSVLAIPNNNSNHMDRPFIFFNSPIIDKNDNLILTNDSQTYYFPQQKSKYEDDNSSPFLLDPLFSDPTFIDSPFMQNIFKLNNDSIYEIVNDFSHEITENNTTDNYLSDSIYNYLSQIDFDINIYGYVIIIIFIIIITFIGCIYNIKRKYYGKLTKQDKKKYFQDVELNLL